MVMTWTVESRTSVSGEGTWPYDIEVAYSNTYNKGTVRSGDDAVLALSHLEGITVEQVDVYVKSNNAAGGGTFVVAADGETIASKSGTLKQWTGAYDGDTYHAVRLYTGARADVDGLAISLHGTENSLYIEKYVIQFTMGAPHTVTLMRGEKVHAQLTEEQGGAGVLLPNLPDTAEWQFAGWCKTAFTQTQTKPALRSPNSMYYPSGDETLWAVYRHDDQLEKVYATELESGEYLYVNRANDIALTGVPADGKMGYAGVDPANDNQVYTVELVGTDTAYITHTMTETPIGYKGTNMAAVASPWRVYHSGEETRFYTVISKKTYVLWLGVWGVSGTMSAGLFHVDNLSDSPLALCYPDKPEETVYTCYPGSGMGLQSVQRGTDGKEYILRLGNYELRIHNGKKELKIEN